MIKTTKQQFKLFCDEFKRQIERMGLMEWRLDFQHEKITQRNVSELNPIYQDRVVGVFFNTETDEPLADASVLATAKHEAIELLVDDAFTIGQSRFLTIDEVISTRHTLVRRLEKLL